MPTNRLDISAAIRQLSARPIRDARKETLFSELNSLLSSGLDFSHAFSLLIDGEGDKNIRSVLQKLYRDVVAGSSLWQALEGCGKFSTLDSRRTVPPAISWCRRRIYAN